MKAVDLGLVTYSFVIFNFSLLLQGLLRICVAVCFAFVSMYTFSSVRDVTFTALISETAFIGMNEIAMFILGVLAGFKNNLRLMYTYEFLVSLLVLTKILSIGESARIRDIVNEDLQLSVEDMFNEFRSQPKDAPGRLNVLAIQSRFECCGVSSPRFYLYDWDASCCPPDAMEDSPGKKCVLQLAWPSGCIEHFFVPDKLFKMHFYTLFPVCEVILLIMGISLITFIRKSARRTFG